MIISHFWCSNFFTYLSEICKIFLQVLNTNFEEIYCLGVLMWGFITMTPARKYRKKHDFAATVWSQRVDPETGAEMGNKLSDSLCSCTGKPAGTQNKAPPGSNYILSFKMIIQLAVYSCFLNHLEIANCSCNYLIFCLTGTMFLKLWVWHSGETSVCSWGCESQPKEMGGVHLCSLIICNNDRESKGILSRALVYILWKKVIFSLPYYMPSNDISIFCSHSYIIK